MRTFCINREGFAKPLTFEDTQRASLRRRLKTLARRHDNPRFLKIHFHMFRHCKALREYHKPRSILHVKRILGRKSIQNTLLYTQLVTFEADRFTCRTAETIEEAKDLIEAGFEFATHMNGVELFRKPK